MRQPGLNPFYERATERLPGPSPFIWKVCFAVILGLVCLTAHFKVAGEDMFQHWGWMPSVLAGSSLLLVYYATFTLRSILPQIDRRLQKKGKPYSRAEQAYFVTLSRKLSDRMFLLWGIAFGLVNCLMGYWFGLPYASARARAVTFGEFFVVGFVCGMAALGIYGVLHMIKAFMRAESLEIDYSAPDGCGGTLFLGEALVKFGSVTLSMGVLIALFIVNFPWADNDGATVKALRWFWIAFPFALSLIVMLAPSAEINRVLSEYKVEQEDRLDDYLAELRTRSSDPELSAGDREAARKDYDYYNKLRAEVYKMRTWPYAVSSSLEYVGMFLGNAAVIGWNAIAAMLKVKGP